jgi:hypothetical protein
MESNAERRGAPRLRHTASNRGFLPTRYTVSGDGFRSAGIAHVACTIEL